MSVNPGAAEAFGHAFGRVENADGFGEIAERAVRAGDQAGGGKHEPEGIERVEGPLPPPPRQREFEGGEPAPRLEDAEDLADPPVEVDEVAQAEADRGRVERGVGEREAFGVALDEGDDRPVPGPPALPPSGLHHGAVEVADDRPARPSEALGGPQGQVGRAAADIEDALAGPESEPPDRGPFPEEVEAQAEQGIGPVVGPGDRRELVVDEPLLFLGADRPVSERNLICGNAHGPITLG